MNNPFEPASHGPSCSFSTDCPRVANSFVHFSHISRCRRSAKRSNHKPSSVPYIMANSRWDSWDYHWLKMPGWLVTKSRSKELLSLLAKCFYRISSCGCGFSQSTPPPNRAKCGHMFVVSSRRNHWFKEIVTST